MWQVTDLAVLGYGACIGVRGSGQDTHDHRLACAVVSDQRDAITGVHLQRRTSHREQGVRARADLEVCCGDHGSGVAGGVEVAPPQPFRGAQAPAVGLGVFAGGLEMGGDQPGILVGGAWVARFDRVREAFVGAYPGRDQLRFVCHRANQRMAKAIPLSRNELRLIDQLGGYQVGQMAGLDLR